MCDSLWIYRPCPLYIAAYDFLQMLNAIGFQKALKKFEKVTKVRSSLFDRSISDATLFRSDTISSSIYARKSESSNDIWFISVDTDHPSERLNAPLSSMDQTSRA